jgi:predicted Zn-dependent protease
VTAPRRFKGRLATGREARTQRVAVSLADAGLRVEGEAKSELWPFSGVILLEDEHKGGAVRLAYGEARLTIDDSDFAPALHGAAPQLAAARHRGLVYAGIAAAIFLVLAAALWFALPSLADAATRLIPPRWEERVGDDMLSLLAEKRCTGSGGLAALDALARRLTASVAMPYPPEVVVADQKIVNAVALPGARIIVFRGLIDEAQSAEEVAGVLAHELTHSLKRHPTRLLITLSGSELVLEIVTGGGASLAIAQYFAAQSYTREAEAEADAGAIAMLEATGIDVGGFAEFFERLEKNENAAGAIPAFLASHPPPAERGHLARAHAQRNGGSAMSGTDWEALRHVCGE